MKKSLIVTVPNQILKKVTNKITKFDEELLNQAELMVNILHEENGIGLAANQIGIDNQVLVVEFDDPEKKETIPLHVFINPEIAELSEEKETADEGCLSVPQIELPIERSTQVKVKAQDLNGKKIKLTAKGLFARVLQHEIDHLNGKVFTEKVRENYLNNNPKIKDLKIVFIGSGDFAEPIFRGLILTGHSIISAITEAPKPSGRNKNICPTPVATTASTFNIKLIETDDISKIDIPECDLIILVDFGQILPEKVLNHPKISAINIHPSLLPKYRGPSPIQTAILKGEKETGVSIIKMDPQIDKGPIVAQQAISISDYDTHLSLKMILISLSLKMLMKVLPEIKEKKLKLITQKDEEATNTKKFKKEDGEIDWKQSPVDIDRKIRAFFPWPGTFTFVDNKRLLIHQAHVKEGKLTLDVVQPEGKRPMLWQDFLKGYHGQKPDWFGKIKNG